MIDSTRRVCGGIFFCIFVFVSDLGGSKRCIFFCVRSGLFIAVVLYIYHELLVVLLASLCVCMSWWVSGVDVRGDRVCFFAEGVPLS